MTDVLHVQEHGAGTRTIVLLHGLFGLGNNLAGVARVLAAEARVLLPDLRNHGRSFHAVGMDYSAMAGDLVRLLDSRGVVKAALLGHSMGGKVAMQFALDHGDRCERLLVADIAPVAYTGHHQAVFRALRTVAACPDADRRATQHLLEEAGLPSDVVALLSMHRMRTEDGQWRWRLGLDSIEAGYPEILAAPRAVAPYTGPVLFLKGQNSDYIGAQHTEAIRELFPAARLKILAGAGHWLHAEKPDAFARLAREFLLASSA